MIKSTKEDKIKNLVDEKYYRQVSNIVNCDDDMTKFLSMFYDFNEFPEFKNNTHDDLTNSSSVCVLGKSNEVFYFQYYNVSAYYIPIDVNVIKLNEHPISQYDEPKRIDLFIENSLQSVLEESRKLPSTDNVINNYHRYGSKTICINNIWYKRIEADLPEFRFTDIDEPNLNMYEEHLIYLFEYD